MSTTAYPFAAVSGIDSKYPGTATARLTAVLERVQSIADVDLCADWEAVRFKLLWAGGLRVLATTGHAFNDDNHCDLTTMASGSYTLERS